MSKFTSKQFLRISLISLAAIIPLIILIVLLPESIASIITFLLMLDFVVIFISLILWISKKKEEKTQNLMAKEIDRKVKAQEAYEAKRQELKDMYRNHYFEIFNSAEEILEFKLQKTQSKERQDNILNSFLFETLELIESISDDSCAVKSSAGVVGELSASNIKQIAAIPDIFYAESLLDEESGKWGMKIQAIRRKP